MLLYYLPLALYVVIVPIINEGVELPRSLALVNLMIIYAIFRPQGLKVSQKIDYLPFLMPIFYFFSALTNGQNILSALFGGYNRNFGILTYLALALLYISITNLNNDVVKFFKFCLLPVTLISIAYASIQLYGSDFLNWAEKDRVLLTLGNSNFAASFLGIISPVLIYAFVRNKLRYIKLTYLFLFFVLIYFGYKTGSFQFRVVALVGITVFIFIYNYQRVSNYNIFKRVTAFILSLGLITLYIVNNRNTLNEFTNADDRISQQIAGLKIFRDYPLFGVGVDELPRYMPRYITPQDIRREGYDSVADRTHNSFVDHFANGGIFVGVSYIIFIIFILYAIFKLVRTSEAKNSNLALVCAITISYIAQLFFNTDNILNMIIPYISMGIISSMYRHSRSKNRESLVKSRSKKMIRIGSVLFFTLISSLSGRVLLTDYNVREILTGRIIDTKEIVSVVYEWPNRRPTEKIIVKLAQDLRNCQFIETLTDRLLEVDPLSGQAWFVKSVCADAQGNQKISLEFINKAVIFQPLNVRYLDAKFKLEEYLGLQEEAEKTSRFINSILLP
jgi:O-antigen ligase